jgi:hypothetical protein
LLWLLWQLEARQENAATASSTVRISELSPSHG